MKEIRLPRGSVHKNLYPTETCPVCGKKWTRYCRRNEWGYYYNASESQIDSYLTLLCSPECSKKYAEMRMLEKVRKVARSRSAQALKLIDQGVPYADAMKAVGMHPTYSLSVYEDVMWQEIEWLRAHNWEVPA